MLAKRIALAASAVAAITLASSGLAGKSTNTSNLLSNVYVGGNIGYGKTNESFTNTSAKNKGFVWSVDTGYAFNKTWAIEAGFTQLPNVKAEDTTAVKQNRIINLVAKGTYDINNAFNIFGKLGLAYTHSYNTALVSDAPNQSNSAIEPYFGAGVGYNLTQDIALNLQGFAVPKHGDTVPAMYGATVGLQYSF
jgi:OOP family OmpA-OmpF porin